jgi:hypothetical protein
MTLRQTAARPSATTASTISFFTARFLYLISQRARTSDCAGRRLGRRTQQA